jgi:polyisoprenoid-binding protein YceI
MKIRPWFICGRLFLFLAVAQAAVADDWVRYSASPTGSSAKVDGTSTFHDWTMESKLIAGSIELDGKVQLDPAKATIDGLDGGKLPMKAKILIPVRALKSHATAMDNVCQDAMEADKFPRIEYRLADLAVKPGEHKPSTPFEFDATGELVVHGVTNKITMPVTIERLDDTRLKIKGATALKMTNYGVKPPSPSIALGAIKTGDDVKIAFEWLVVKRPGNTQSAAK